MLQSGCREVRGGLAENAGEVLCEPPLPLRIVEERMLPALPSCVVVNGAFGSPVHLAGPVGVALHPCSVLLLTGALNTWQCSQVHAFQQGATRTQIDFILTKETGIQGQAIWAMRGLPSR